MKPGDIVEILVGPYKGDFGRVYKIDPPYEDVAWFWVHVVVDGVKLLYADDEVYGAKSPHL